MVYSFAAAGVANHVVAIADNDTAAYTALEKVENDPKLPARFKILHYPDLPLLEQYPTLGPYQSDPVSANVNGTAGALEMYLGRDVLASEGSLAPVQWTSWDSKAGRYQGSLLPGDKRRVQPSLIASSGPSTDPIQRQRAQVSRVPRQPCSRWGLVRETEEPHRCASGRREIR
ncbi:MAG: hypothetical protein ACRDNW_26100, partial [Trebonia sp.]